MKRFVCIALILFLTASLLLTACVKENPTKTCIVYEGRLLEIDPEVTYSRVYDDNMDLIDATLVDPDTLPSRELECNARAAKAQVYVENDGSITVVLDGTGHITKVQ